MTASLTAPLTGVRTGIGRTLRRSANALRLPPRLRSLDPKPLYARAPDARPREAA